FTPEFRNRLDAVIQFNALSPQVIASVVDKQLTELQAQLDERKVQIEVNKSAREWLADKGYDKLMGARPMARLVQEKIKKSLAEDILFGKLINGGLVKIGVKGGELSFKIEPAKDKAPASDVAE
ncbi:MAG: hypothetical protein MI784_06100, partial [Cytophagales bacterium]|nr:hypothetical protein [Cytophagales bacterium]